MRIFHALFLILAFLTGQAHACSGFWVLPDGSDCKTCPIEQCVSGSPVLCGKSEQAQLSKFDKDCHSCCSLKSCEDRGVTKKAIRVATVFPVIALPTVPVIEIQIPIVEPRAVHVEIETCYPNAPPDCGSPRAPPFHLS